MVFCLKGEVSGADTVCSRLIAYFARLQAARPETWNGRVPGEEKVGRLADEIVLEWEGAVGQMLRCWETPPTR